MTETTVKDHDEEQDEVQLGSLPDSIGFMLRMAQITAFQRLFESFESDTLKPGEFSTLWVISINPGIKQGLLAKTLQIKPAHMTKLLHRMVQAGYVRREVPADDRRSVLLFLTPDGRELVDRQREIFVDRNDGQGLGLTKAETAQLLRLLQKIAFQRMP